MAGTLIVEYMLDSFCNLNCSYCYSKHTPPNPMDKETALKFFDRIEIMMKAYNKDSYHLSYFGGEPLVNWDIIELTLPLFEKDPRCKSYVVITNGLLLTQEKVNFLKAHKCGISLSFDGIWQDTNRPQADKSSTFNFFMDNKDLIHQITSSCKVMISPRNFSTMTENLEFFVEQYGFLRPDFCLVRDNIYRQSDIETYEKEIKRLADRIIQYHNDGIPASCGLIDLYTLDILANQRFGKRSHGCSVGTGFCEYSCDGNFWPCERFRSANKFKLWDSESGLNENNVNFLKEPKNSDPRVFEECQKCEIYEYCNTGCNFSELLLGEWQRRKPVETVCMLFKYSYREAMRVFRNSSDSYKEYLFRRLETGS